MSKQATNQTGFGLAPIRREGYPYEWQDRMDLLGEGEKTARRRATEALKNFREESDE